MNYNEIKKLMDDMGEAKIDEINIEFPDGLKISMKNNMTHNNLRLTDISISSA